MSRCYSDRMPTTRPRHAITETPAVEAALAAAAQRWPEDRDRPGRLLLRLIEAGQEHIAPESAQRVEARRAAIRHQAGALTGAYGPGYLDELREDWDE